MQEAGRKRALVLGGTTHLGGAVTRALVDAGVETAATYRTREHAAALAKAGVHLVQADAADGAGLRRALGGLCVEWGVPDVFIHCLTVGKPRALGEITEADWSAAHDINVRSAFIAIQELAPRMAEHGGGDVVLTAALDGIQPVPAPAHFAASQAALLGMTRALAKELGSSGLRVNLVVLGVLDGGLAGALPSRLLADYKKFSALGRVGTAVEAARAVRWLALENRYMTGQTVTLSGGI